MNNKVEKKAAKKPRCITDLMDQVIREQGYSVRKAKQIRKAIFDRWARALYRGEIVETPLGEMQAVKAPKRRARINRVNKPFEIVIVNTRERRIVFRPWPWLIEILPTTFYQEADAALLEKLGRKPWATSPEQHEENVAAIKAALAAAAAIRITTAKQNDDDERKRMNPYQIAARAQRPLSELLSPAPPRGWRW